MDSVRFGRALGTGAREAAKALISAADAAAAPAPEAKPARPPVAPKAAAPDVIAQAAKTAKGVREGGRRFGEAMWGPFVKLSGVVWLEVMGVFFALFAGFAGVSAWKMRPGLHGAGSRGFYVAVGMAVVFGYFCASSYVRASRRVRR